MYGFIDKSGNWKIAASFIVANDFNEGYAIVIKYLNGKDNYFLIDKSGNIKFQFPLGLKPEMERVKEGLILVKDKKSWMYGYLDVNGKLVIPCKYSLASEFNEGLAKVNVANEFGEYKWGFVDKSGSIKINFKFSKEPTNFNSGLSMIQDTQNHFGFIDKNGNVVIEPKFERTFPFDSGYALVSNEEDQRNLITRIIDTKGTTISTLKDVSIYQGFKGGFALAVVRDGYNFIDTKGNFLLSHPISYPSSFSGGIAIIYWNDDKFQSHEEVIDNTGKVLFE